MTKNESNSSRDSIRKTKKPNARNSALETLIEILEDGAHANIAVNKRLSQFPLKGPERGLFTELVYGVTRTRNTLDWVLAKFLKKDLESFTPQIRNILRLGTYQLLYLDKIPAHAAINESVEQAKIYGHKGVAGLVNGVLRNLLRQKDGITFPSIESDPVKHISLKYSHPEWLVSRWIEEFGTDSTITLCQYNNSPANLAIRVNTLKTTREELYQNFLARGLKVIKSTIIPEGIIFEEWPGLENMPEFADGLFLMQDEGSMLVAHVLNPLNNTTIVDACAAPGTKTTHLAQLIGDEGKVLAFDIHPHKLKLIEDNCKRLGIRSVEINLGDARELANHVQEKVDFVLVDAPCSGLGVLGRRADARWRKTPELLNELPLLQIDILKGASKILSPDGVLVYSTCSIAREENQEVIVKFLADNDDFYLESIIGHLPFTLNKEEDIQRAKEGMLQFLPQEHGIDGFFVARLRKKKAV